MPKLKPSEIPGYIGAGKYESPFPAAEMSNGVAGSAWTDIAEATAPIRSWRAAQAISMLAIGQIAKSHGVADWQVPMVKKLSDLGEMASGKDFVELAKAGARLFGDLLNYSEAINTVASAIPLVGTYARLIVGFVTFLKNAFSRGKSAKLSVPKTARDSLGYNRQIDQDVCNFCAEHLNADDWTRVFLPAAKPGDSFKLVRTSFVGDGTPDGMTILPRSGTDHERGLGFCPGVAGRLVQWQYPLKVFNSNRPASPWESLISIADLEPSVSQLTVLAWQMVLKNSANMFRIKPYEIVTRWSDYFAAAGDFARYVKKNGDPEVLNRTGLDQAVQMLEAIATWVGKEYEGAPNYRVRNPWTKYKRSALESGEVQTVEAGDLVRHIVHRQHGDSLDAALATITVAYVGPRFALIKENDTVREKWEARRKQLLNHRARWLVERDLVPDQDYRAALNEARRGPKPADIEVKTLGGVVRFADPDKPPPPASAIEPTMPNSAGGGSGKPPAKGKGGDGAVALLGLLAAGFLLTR